MRPPYGFYNTRPVYVNRRRGRDTYFVLLLFQLFQQVYQLENKPPVTLALFAANLLLFFKDVLPIPEELLQHIPDVHDACLNPAKIFKGGQWQRILWSAFTHADEAHVYYNMSSLIWKGVQLERRMGSTKFALLVLELLLVSHGLMAATCWGLAAHFKNYRYLAYDTCAVGFSAVLFGLKVVLNYDSPGYSNVMGMELPTKYLCWAELLLASYMNPQASFMGHLAGIAAGFLHILVTSRSTGIITTTIRRVQRLGPQLRSWTAFGRPARPSHRSGGRLGVGSSVRRSNGSGASHAATVPSAPEPSIPSAPPLSTDSWQHQQQQHTMHGGAAGPAAAASGDASRGHVLGSSHPQSEAHGHTASRVLSPEELRQLRLRRFAAGRGS